MEDEDESLSSSEPSDSGDDFIGEPEDDIESSKSSTSDNDDENSNSEAEHEVRRSSIISSASGKEDRKFQNVDALVRSVHFLLGKLA